MTYTIQNLISRFEELKLPKMAENINTYLDMIVDGRKTVLESLGELCELELSNKTVEHQIKCTKKIKLNAKRNNVKFNSIQII